MPPDDPRGRGLYVHVPFCVRACPYCDFDFEVRRAPAFSALRAAYEREIRARGLAGLGFRTLYVGGGTPSALGAAGLADLLAFLRGCFDLSAVEEVTVEVNPEHADGPLVEVLAAAGATRLSLGVQSFDARTLALLGRAHDPKTARRAVRRALAAGLSVGVDLIVGVPGAPEDVVRSDVGTAVDLGVDHVSVYALTLEPGVPWHALVRRGRRALPDPDAQASALRLAEARLGAAGFEHYEIANYARDGRVGIHNLGYWCWRDYVGIGPSAASAVHRDGGVARRTNARGLAAYAGGGAADEEFLPADPAAREGVWLGLRRLGGFEAAALLARFGRTRAWLDRVLAPLLERGWVVVDGDRVRPAAGAWWFHDALGRAILAGP